MEVGSSVLSGTPPLKDAGTAVRAVMSAVKVISQPLSRGGCDCVPGCPVALSWQRGILGCPVRRSSLAQDEIHPLAASQDITLALGRRDSSGRASFLSIRKLPSPFVQTQLFLNESNSVSIMSHPVKRLWNMSACTKRSMAVYRSSPDPRAGLFFWKPKWGAAIRVHFWGHIWKKKMTFFLPIDVQKKKKNKLLSVCVLSGMSRGVLPAQQWAQEREALEESAKTHAAARLRLRRPSGGSLWPSLSLCKNQWCVM